MYELDKETLRREILACVREIPYGEVATYGDIAKLVGAANYARYVGFVLKLCDDAGVPWHRVVRADGRLASSNKVLQTDRLRAEGVEAVENRVDLNRYRWLNL